MPFGLEVKNTFDTFLIAPNFPNYGIFEKGTSGATKTLPDIPNLLVLGKSKEARDYDSMLPNSLWHSYNQKYVLLTPIKDIPYKKTYGLETYSPTGIVEFTSEVEYAYIHSTHSINLYTFMSHVPPSTGAFSYWEDYAIPFYDPGAVELYIIVSSCVNIGGGTFFDGLSTYYSYDLPFRYILNTTSGSASISIGIDFPDALINYVLSMTQLNLTVFAVYL